MNRRIMQEVIDHLFEFDAGYSGKREYDFNDFLGYLNSRQKREKVAIRKIEGQRSEAIGKDFRGENTDLSILVVLLFRYARGYIKKALAGSRLQTSDEFSFLITLMTYESLTKSELINLQIMEKTTGTEIIRRLVKSGFIKELPDEADRRSTRISITETGRSEILQLLPEMAKVSKIVTGNLSGEEKLTLLFLLKKLDYFHNDIFNHSRKDSLDVLLSKTGISG